MEIIVLAQKLHHNNFLLIISDNSSPENTSDCQTLLCNHARPIVDGLDAYINKVPTRPCHVGPTHYVIKRIFTNGKPNFMGAFSS